MLKLNELLIASRGSCIKARGPLAVNGISIDSRATKTGNAFIAIKGDNFDGHDFIAPAVNKGANTVIARSGTFIKLAGKLPVSKKINFIEVEDTVSTLGDIAGFWRKKFAIPVIAVTGSNGKTTAKEMVAAVLSKRLNVLKNQGTRNNRIGLPMALLGLNQSHKIAVLEIGTNHFGEVSYLAKICQPNIGVITNIGPAHLEYLNNLPGVLREKYTLIENLNPPYISVLNRDDYLLKKKLFAQTLKPFNIGFGTSRESDFFATDIKLIKQRWEFLVNLKYKFRLNTLGRYNIYHALAAIAIGRIFGLAYKEINLGLANFEFPAGRLKLVTFKNTRFIDDTYNANPLSLAGALDALESFKAKGRKILVMGDMLELGDKQEGLHYEIGKRIKSSCDAFISVGKLSRLAARSAHKSGLDARNIFSCSNSTEAAEILFNKLSPKKDDIVLVKGSRRMKMEAVFKNKVKT